MGFLLKLTVAGLFLSLFAIVITFVMMMFCLRSLGRWYILSPFFGMIIFPTSYLNGKGQRIHKIFVMSIATLFIFAIIAKLLFEK